MSKDSVFWIEDGPDWAATLTRAGIGSKSSARSVATVGRPPAPAVVEPRAGSATGQEIADSAGEVRQDAEGVSLEARLRAVLQRLGASMGCSASFVADPDGLALISDGSNEELAAAAVAMARAWVRVSGDLSLATSDVISLWLARERLHLTWTDVEGRRFVLGIVSAAEAPAAALITARSKIAEILVGALPAPEASPRNQGDAASWPPST